MKRRGIPRILGRVELLVLCLCLEPHLLGQDVSLPHLVWPDDPRPRISIKAAKREARILRLERREPDRLFRFRPTWALPHQKALNLVLAGGSSKGLAHIGVLEGLDDEGLAESSLSGTSAGALIGSLRASGLSGSEIRRAFLARDFGQAVFDSRRRSTGQTLEEEEARQAAVFSFEYRPEGWELSSGDTSGRRAAQGLMANLARAAAFSGGDFDRLRCPFRVMVSNLSQGKGELLDRGDLVLAVRASMSLPAIFRPVYLNGQQYIDGGFVENLPIRRAREVFQDGVFVGVDVREPWTESRSISALDMFLRTLALSLQEIDLESRSRVDVLLRVPVKGVSRFDFHGIVDLVADQGRRVFEEKLVEIENRIYGEGLDKPLGVKLISRVGAGSKDHVNPSSEELFKLEKSCFPESETWTFRHAYRFLRRALGRGLVPDLSMALPEAGSQTLHITVGSFRRLKALELDVPSDWKAWVETRLQALDLMPGKACNEVVLGRLLESALLEANLRQRPVLDVRGSGFRDGILHLCFREKPVEAIELATDGKTSLQRHFQPLVGQSLDSQALIRKLDLAETELNFQEPTVALRESKQGWRLAVGGVHHPRARVNLLAAFETTWGFHGEVLGETQDWGLSGQDLEFHFNRNRIQEKSSFTLRQSLSNLGPVGLFLGFERFRHTLGPEITMADPGFGRDFPEMRGFLDGADISSRDLSMGLYLRFGPESRGLASLEYQWRHARFDSPMDFNYSDHQRSWIGSLEWDSYDRHTYPTQGGLLRLRLMKGRLLDPQVEQGKLEDLVPTGTASAYLLARGLISDVVGPVGLDLALELGLGDETGPDRMFIQGGNASFIGTPSTRFLSSNFGMLRLGLPIPIRRDFGAQAFLIPRLDWGRISDTSNTLSSGQRMFGWGAVFRASLGRLTLEVGWGQIQTRPRGEGPTYKDHQVNLGIGCRPFELWQRK